MKLKIALGLLAAIGIAAYRVETIPPFDPSTDVRKLVSINSNGHVSINDPWAVTGFVFGATGVTGNLPMFESGWSSNFTANTIKDSGVLAANIVQVSRAVIAGTGLKVTNSGLLSADITMSMSPTGFQYISPQTTKGDLISYSTEPARVALGVTGQVLEPDLTTSTGVAWVTDRTGVIDGSSAATGKVGEWRQLVRTAAAATGVTTNVAKNVGDGGIVLRTLTPGDWEIKAICGFITATTTSITALQCSVSKASATLSGFYNVPSSCEVVVAYVIPAFVPGNGVSMQVQIPTFRCSVTVNTDIYLVGMATFTASTLTMDGNLEARRIR